MSFSTPTYQNGLLRMMFVTCSAYGPQLSTYHTKRVNIALGSIGPVSDKQFRSLYVVSLYKGFVSQDTGTYSPSRGYMQLVRGAGELARVFLHQRKIEFRKFCNTVLRYKDTRLTLLVRNWFCLEKNGTNPANVSTDLAGATTSE
jgi:hypothetical protein